VIWLGLIGLRLYGGKFLINKLDEKGYLYTLSLRTERMRNNNYSKWNAVEDIIRNWIYPIMQIVLTIFLMWQVILTRNQFKKYEPQITGNVTGYYINYTPFIFEEQSTGEIQLTRIFRDYLIKANEIKNKYSSRIDILSSQEYTREENRELNELWKKYFKYDDFKICIRVNITNESLTTVSISQIFPWLTPSEEKGIKALEEDIKGLVWQLQKIYEIKDGYIKGEKELPLTIYSGESVILDVVFYSNFFYSEDGETKEDKVLEIFKRLKKPFIKKLLKISGNFGSCKIHFEMCGSSSLNSLYSSEIRELYKTFPEF